MKYCTNCGCANDLNDVACTDCGHPHFNSNPTAPARLVANRTADAPNSQKIVGLMVGTIGALTLAAGTASLANFGARGMNIDFIILGVVSLAFGIRAVQRDRPYFFTQRGLAIFGFVVCNCFALYFFLDGEDSPFDYSTPGANGQWNLFRERGVSAFTYYFLWPKSQREAVSKGEDNGYALYLMLHGFSAQDAENIAIKHNSSSWMLFDEQKSPVTLSDLMCRNIAVATIGILGALVFALVPLLGRFISNTVPNTALEPTGAAPSVVDAPGNPKVSGESTSASSGGGSTLDR